MEGADWACCYVLVEGRSADDIAAMLGGQPSDKTCEERGAGEAPWLAVGTIGDGWALLVDPHFEYGDSADELLHWSEGTRIVCLQIIEPEGFSHAMVWTAGALAWEISYEAELDARPLVDGQPPYDLDAIARTIGPLDDSRTWCQVPIAVVRLLTGWQPGLGGDRGQVLLREVVRQAARRA